MADVRKTVEAATGMIGDICNIVAEYTFQPLLWNPKISPMDVGYSEDHRTIHKLTLRYTDLVAAFTESPLMGDTYLRVRIIRKGDELWMGFTNDVETLMDSSNLVGNLRYHPANIRAWGYYGGRRGASLKGAIQLDTPAQLDSPHGHLFEPGKGYHVLHCATTGDVVGFRLNSFRGTMAVDVNGVPQATLSIPQNTPLYFFATLDYDGDQIAFV